MRQAIVFVLIAVIFIVLGAGGAYIFLQNKTGSIDIPTPTPKVAFSPALSPTPQAVASPTPTKTESQITSPAGWTTHRNEKYGFEISFPKTYQALTDKENLYGWPNAIVLIYSGGQSYDLPVEHWDAKATYEAKYKNMPNLIVKEVNGIFITLINMNHNPEVDQIIQTFKEI